MIMRALYKFLAIFVEIAEKRAKQKTHCCAF